MRFGPKGVIRAFRKYAYPKELDGWPEGKPRIARELVQMWQTLRDSASISGLRRLMVESATGRRLNFHAAGWTGE